MSDDIDESRLELYPAWRQALITFRERRYGYDAIVPHAEFYGMLNLEIPGPKTPYEQVQKTELLYLSNMDALRDALLRDDQIVLRSEFGVGYRVVHPRDQARLAFEDAARQRKKANRKMLDQITHTNMGALTADERRAHADTQAKAAMIAMMERHTRKLPILDAPTDGPEG